MMSSLVSNNQKIVPNIKKEPDFETACSWWEDLDYIWTPIGWKDHLLRFNVLWNGTIISGPYPYYPDHYETEEWRKQGIQLAFIPSADGNVPEGKDKLRESDLGSWRRFMPISIERDNKTTNQGWNKTNAPVLWSEWPRTGFLLRQEIFAHVPGGSYVETGIEPHFAWVRLSIADTCNFGLSTQSKYYGFLLKINAVHFLPKILCNRESGMDYHISAYPRILSPDRGEYSRDAGYRLMEEKGKVRLAIAPGQECRVKFYPREHGEKDNYLYIQIPANKGSHVDLLVPAVPLKKTISDEELNLGYEEALMQAERFWSKRPKTSAQVQVPEPYINEAIKRYLQFAEVIARKDPANGYYSLITGSYRYSRTWGTSASMTIAFTLDAMGYHKTAKKYLEIFGKAQGTKIPPGVGFKTHPGYLGVHESAKAIDWITDHGAILFAICNHALLTGDKDFIQHWIEPVEKACDFIKYARRIKGHGGFEGILPPGIGSDGGTTVQSSWCDGWTYKGLITAVKLFERISHPRAEEFAAEAEEYRKAFTEVFRKCSFKMPKWTDKKGKSYHLAPNTFFLAGTHDIFQLEKTEEDVDGKEFLGLEYLDFGPLFLVFSGLLDADEEAMKSMLLWFREGPQTKFFSKDSMAVGTHLEHEISNQESSCSWNIFHSHQLGDRIMFLEGLYSLFAGAISRKTFSIPEIRGGIFGVTPSHLSIYLLQLSAIDYLIRDNELHLLRLMPLAWLKKGSKTFFENTPTYYGPVTLKTKVSRDGKVLEVNFKPKFRISPKKIVVHRPPLEGLTRINVNGKEIDMHNKSKAYLKGPALRRIP